MIKYNSSGTELWSANYNGEANSTDQIFKGYADPSGNSYVTGFTTNLNSNNIITTAKYDSSGNLNGSGISILQVIQTVSVRI
ncbi:MAG: hypothetical protein R3A12_16235 [Ignavibacteria bacterium]